MKVLVTADELMDKGRWDEYCEDHGINIWAVKEGLMSSDDTFSLTEDEAKKYGFVQKD